MEILEMMKDGRTETYFGRHHEELGCLEEAIAHAGFDEHHALIIGAGLDFLPYAGKWMEGTPLQNNRGLRRAYSWETLEVAAILERRGKPWDITVVDNSADVCAALRQQNELIADSFYTLKEPENTDYVKRFLAAFGISANDDAEMKAINKALKSESVGNRLSVFKKVEIPQHIKDRIQIVHGSIINIGAKLPKSYNLGVCFNVMMYVPSGFEPLASESVRQAVTEGGIVAIDSALPGFRPLRTFISEYEIQGYCGETDTVRHERYILTKEPVLKLAKPEKAVLLPA